MSQLKKNLTIVDITGAGYGYIVGAGIFSLLPMIVKYSKGYSWLAFILGLTISICTSFSYSVLNTAFPGNEGEYKYIKEVFKDWNKSVVEVLASSILYGHLIEGTALCSFIVLSITSFADLFKNQIPNVLKNLFFIGLPTLINLTGGKSTTSFNNVINILVNLGLFAFIGGSLYKGKNYNQLQLIPKNKTEIVDLIRAVFITALPFNGFQSLVNMNEEAKDVNDIPKGMVGSLGLSGLVYILITIATIVLLGITKSSNSVSPVAEGYQKLFGNWGKTTLNLISILSGLTSLIVILYSRSRLLMKMASMKKVPSIFGKLHNSIPIYSILSLFGASFGLTLFKGNVLELLVNVSNTVIFFIFASVNFTMIYYYYSKDEENRKKHTYPIYAIIGLITTLILFFKSFEYYF